MVVAPPSVSSSRWLLPRWSREPPSPVLDDDASIRETFEGHLHDTGSEVATAATSEPVLLRVAEVDPGLVITDVRMPGIDGIQLHHRLRESRPEISAIVITCERRDEERDGRH